MSSVCDAPKIYFTSIIETHLFLRRCALHDLRTGCLTFFLRRNPIKFCNRCDEVTWSRITTGSRELFSYKHFKKLLPVQSSGKVLMFKVRSISSGRWWSVMALAAAGGVGCDSSTTPAVDSSVVTDIGVDATPDVATDVITVDTNPQRDVVSEDVAMPTDGAPDAAMATIRVRVAHLSPGAPAVDFCARPTSATTWMGVTPTLRGIGRTAGLSYGQVTAYLTLPAGAYLVRLVAPGSTNCDTALGGLPDTTLPALAAGVRATVAAIGTLDGMGPTAFRLNPYVDDAMMVPAGMARVRFVHASPGTPNVDLGIPGMATMFTSVFSNVAFPESSDASLPPVMGATLAARVAGMATASGAYPLQLAGVTIPAGARITAFAVGQLNNDQTPLSALVCVDSADPVDNLTPCSLLPERVFVRVAHLAPDAPAVDVCVRTAAGTFDGATPVLAGLAAPGGLSFPQVTRYLALPPAAYVVRIVAPGSTSCATALAGLPDTTLPMLASGVRATVVAQGRLAGMGATAFALRPIIDGNTQPALGRIHLRFAHFSPGAPNVDVGVLAGDMFNPVFTNVPFGSVATPMGAEAMTGYLPTDPIMGATLQVRPAGAAMGVLTLPGVTLPATVNRGTAVTVFAIGVVGGTGTQALSAFVCNDRTPATALLAPCTRLP
jgi:hypothetical protein